MGKNEPVSDLPTRQRPITQFALKHPVQLVIASSAVMFVWVTIIVGDWRAEVAVAGCVAAIQAALWNPRGWARKREERLYDETGSRRT